VNFRSYGNPVTANRKVAKGNGNCTREPEFFLLRAEKSRMSPRRPSAIDLRTPITPMPRSQALSLRCPAGHADRIHALLSRCDYRG